jgi:hypothetical protein
MLKDYIHKLMQCFYEFENCDLTLINIVYHQIE